MKAFIRPRSLLLLAAASGLAALALAEPAWWVQRGARDPAKAPSDYAVLNQGQLKNLARAARDEMNEKLPGGAGAEIEALITGWSANPENAKDFAAANLGQLKAVARPFYDRMIALGIATGYPWSAATEDDSDHAAANIGQAKAVFGFDIFLDMDDDGIDDNWELAQFGTLNRSNALDADGDGIKDLDEYANGTSAGSWDSDGDGVADAIENTASSVLLASADLRLFQRME